MVIIRSKMFIKAKEPITFPCCLSFIFICEKRPSGAHPREQIEVWNEKASPLGRQEDSGRFIGVAVEWRFLLQCIADRFSGTLDVDRQIKVGSATRESRSNDFL